ncbi:bifunctional 2-polyprenyl-6-hydroxyphenol methylase/3-demethylubiquinol 3-O-methyltransferase UbiG [Mucilaginibacter sp. BT774]|uniref:class I SAM-dependent methyltransferase n=1 Tax=Mucilaginibacter sp. BT774 TaxID=3062276 RepID=UPI0026761F9D|nr:methyltransferase domain-containing protein [Mucilaginibacter sp. BT774]MDO3627484.1 methyltransferase domain-containing protein [Mucilaginibacter sp. BT774]
MAEYKDYGYTTNEPSHTFFYLHNALLSMLNKANNRCILDLGCGNGHLVSYLIQQGYLAYGTDASEKGIAIAKKEYPERFFVQDLSTGQLPAELGNLKFDTIISTEVIEHLYDPEGFIDFCKNLLPTGGELILSTPYHGYWKNLILAILGKWDSHHDPTWHGGHIKFWSKNTLSNLLTDKGFTVKGFKGCGRAPYFWKSMIIKAKLV